MRAALLDTGQVVAYLAESDRHHAAALVAIRASVGAGRMICTTWEVVGEAYTLLRTRGAPSASHRHAMEVLGWAWDSGVTVLGSTELDHRRAGEILERHEDLRLSYVDALLLAIADRHGIEDVLTVDGPHLGAVRLEQPPLLTVV